MMLGKHPMISSLPGARSGRTGAFESPRASKNHQRERWITTCAARLGELRPNHDPAVTRAIARDLWSDVWMFDPEIAAEIEHETWQ